MPNQEKVPPHFLVIVPGYMGSLLRNRKTGKPVWIDFTSIPANPFRWDDWFADLEAQMRYPNDELEAFDLVNDVLLLLPWAKQEQYSRLLAELERMGYRVDPRRFPEEARNVYTFPYDWRQDNRRSARQLAEAVDRWKRHHPSAEVWIIAHSNGGLVARWYVEKEGGDQHVTRLLLMGSPWDGTPKAMYMLLNGFDTLFRRRFNLFGIPERTRTVLRTFPSIYQLIPTARPFLFADDQPFDPFADRRWLDQDDQNALLEDARQFYADLGTTYSVETLSFFGRRRQTTSKGFVEVADSRLQVTRWAADTVGDGTIPEYSAVHPGAEDNFPFASGHGDIYADPAVVEFLRWELRDKFLAGVRAALVTQHVHVVFEPEEDVVSPGEPIRLWATVHSTENNAPVQEANIRVHVQWRQALPGDPAPPSPPPAVHGRLLAAEEPGRYEGQVSAPQQEGLYELSAVLTVPGQLPLVLREVVAVEALPEG